MSLSLFCVVQGERDGPLHFVDSSKAPTPASRYGGALTPLSYHLHSFEIFHMESLREKLARLTRDKGFNVLMCLF